MSETARVDLETDIDERGALERTTGVTARPLSELTDRTRLWARPAGPRVGGQAMLPGTGRPVLSEVAASADRGDWSESNALLPDGLEDVITAGGRSDPKPGRDGGDGLPDAEGWSRWLAQLIVEVVQGRRPSGQLARWTDERVLATIVLRSRQVRGQQRRDPARDAAAAVGALRVQRPAVGAVEASAVIRGPRSRALAFRLEARNERWVCTDVDFGPQTPQPS